MTNPDDRIVFADPVQAVRALARRSAHPPFGWEGSLTINMLADHEIRAIVRAVYACADGILDASSMVPRYEWEIETARAEMWRRLRRELMIKVADDGLLPIELPTKDLRFVSLMSTARIDNDGGGAAFPSIPEQSTGWDTAIARLSVRSRRPEIDRTAAVQAGLLDRGVAGG